MNCKATYMTLFSTYVEVTLPKNLRTQMKSALLHASGEDSSLDFLQLQKVSFFNFCVLTIQPAYNINRQVTGIVSNYLLLQLFFA